LEKCFFPFFAKGYDFLFVPQRAPTFFFSAKKKVAKKKLSAAFLTGQPLAAFPVRNARRKSFLENRSFQLPPLLAAPLCSHCGPDPQSRGGSPFK